MEEAKRELVSVCWRRSMSNPSFVPRPTPFFSVLWFALTIIHGCRRAALLSTQTEEQKKWGRSGNEASLVPSYSILRPDDESFLPTLSHSV